MKPAKRAARRAESATGPRPAARSGTGAQGRCRPGPPPPRRRWRPPRSGPGGAGSRPGSRAAGNSRQGAAASSCHQRQPRRRAVGHGHRDRAVQLDDRRAGHVGAGAGRAGRSRPVGGLRRRRRTAWQPAMAAWTWYWPSRWPARAASRSGSRYLGLVPAGAVLVLQGHQVTAVVHPRRLPRAVEQHEGEQPGASGSPGSSSASTRSGRTAWSQRSPRKVVSGACRVTLVEYQIEDGQDARHPQRKRSAGGTR